jgi:hypothetical protein
MIAISLAAAERRAVALVRIDQLLVRFLDPPQGQGWGQANNASLTATNSH